MILADGTVIVPEHWHHPIRRQSVPYQGPIVRPVHPGVSVIARGGVTIIEFCACGAQRHTNRRARAFEQSGWFGGYRRPGPR